MCHLILTSWQSYSLYNHLPILQIRKSRLREVEEAFQGHAATLAKLEGELIMLISQVHALPRATTPSEMSLREELLPRGEKANSFKCPNEAEDKEGRTSLGSDEVLNNISRSWSMDL